MICQTNQSIGADAEHRSDANSADSLVSSGRIENIADGTVRSMEQRRAIPPKFVRAADVRAVEARALEAHVERRRKLAARIRQENPTRSEEEIEARLEQFGA